MIEQAGSVESIPDGGRKCKDSRTSGVRVTFCIKRAGTSSRGVHGRISILVGVPVCLMKHINGRDTHKGRRYWHPNEYYRPRSVVISYSSLRSGSLCGKRDASPSLTLRAKC